MRTHTPTTDLSFWHADIPHSVFKFTAIVLMVFVIANIQSAHPTFVHCTLRQGNLQPTGRTVLMHQRRPYGVALHLNRYHRTHVFGSWDHHRWHTIYPFHLRGGNRYEQTLLYTVYSSCMIWRRYTDIGKNRGSLHIYVFNTICCIDWFNVCSESGCSAFFTMYQRKSLVVPGEGLESSYWLSHGRRRQSPSFPLTT